MYSRYSVTIVYYLHSFILYRGSGLTEGLAFSATNSKFNMHPNSNVIGVLMPELGMVKWFLQRVECFFRNKYSITDTNYRFYQTLLRMLTLE